MSAKVRKRPGAMRPRVNTYAATRPAATTKSAGSKAARRSTARSAEAIVPATPPSLERRSGRRARMAAMDRRRVATILIPPLAAWGMSTAAVFGACVWAGASPWQAKPWVHGDGGLYLEIAQHGYVLYRCGIDWCGDTGWFPALPWLAAALHIVTGLSVVGAGVAIAMLFHW